MNRPPLRVLAVVLALLLVGCAGQQPEIREPTYRLERVELLQLGLTEQRFALTLLVDNPNDRALPVRALTYSVDLEGIPLAEGESNDRFTLPANSEHPVRLEVRTRLLESMPELLRRMDLQAGELGYELRGEVEYGTWMRGSRAFERRGRVTLAR